MNQSPVPSANKRLPFLDYARLLTMYLVIFGHLIPTKDMTIRPYFYAFHVPLFFFISGMLHKDYGKIPWRKYLRSIFWPFIFWNILFLFLTPFCITLGIWHITRMEGLGLIGVFVKCGKEFIESFVFGSAHFPCGPTWFLVVLLWCKLMMDLANRYRWTLVVLALMLAGLTVWRCNYFRLGGALMAFPFYLVGFYGKGWFCKMVQGRWIIVWAVLLFLVSIPMTHLNCKISLDTVDFGHFPFLPVRVLLFYGAAFAGSLAVILLCGAFRQRAWAAEWANSLITILCAQSLFNYTYRTHCDRHDFLLCAVASVLILIACFFIHKYLGKWFYLK